jgi:hypothetical protein
MVSAENWAGAVRITPIRIRVEIKLRIDLQFILALQENFLILVSILIAHNLE